MDISKQRQKINAFYYPDEATCVEELIQLASLPEKETQAIERRAIDLVLRMRQQRKKKSLLDAFLFEHDLTSDEGVALMCLAEAMLRIPDKKTVDELIRDKLSQADWSDSTGGSDSFFVNASTFALMLTGKILAPTEPGSFLNLLRHLLRKSGEPFIRQAVSHAMKILGNQFVMGRTIEEALNRASKESHVSSEVSDVNLVSSSQGEGYRYSYDMLGEAARTADDAERYFVAYCDAIRSIATAAHSTQPENNPGISVKLSALYPRYEFAKHDEALLAVTPKLLQLAQMAKSAHIGLTVDAEEARVLELSLDIISAVFCDPSLTGWEGFGLAVQAYQKRAPYVIDWLVALSKSQGRRLMIRLVKGAYWDSEIKYAQVNGLPGYPVFTRKASTDVSYLACAKKILQHPEAFYAQFGTHNAYTIAAILELAKGREDFEFQCLHGMGHAVYDLIVSADRIPCRIYAPVGGHKELLAYLVRRLLENGANSSFVNRIAHEDVPVEKIVFDPVSYMARQSIKLNPKIPLPSEIYGNSRQNSPGIDLSNEDIVQEIKASMKLASIGNWVAKPTVNGKKIKTTPVTRYCPFELDRAIGVVHEATLDEVKEALFSSEKTYPKWTATPVADRAAILVAMSDLLVREQDDLIARLVYEAGKTLPDAVGEIREAIDACRYYAEEARIMFEPKVMPGPTGEFNQLTLHGRGPIVCISPWNFPLAIFTAQIAAALVTGNTVIAKPAEQTALIADFIVELFYEAGIPKAVLQLLPGQGEIVGAALVKDERVKGVMFTGSTETARAINLSLAERQGAIVPLIAETGGLNTMIVDSSALLEQVVVDVVQSAFGSAGQRCSALRVVYIQEDIADKFIAMLKGAMRELTVGDPSCLDVDVGPVIDEAALMQLKHHAASMNTDQLIYRCDESNTLHGYFFMPCAYEIQDIGFLKKEVFGPCLHVIRYQADELEEVIDAINATGYGLTQGVHTRISEKANRIADRLRVGNVYVNRNMIGAVIGVQPFGGEGLSGTGPKAGGPHYLYRLVTERTLTIDTTASGGNASLLMLSDDE